MKPLILKGKAYVDGKSGLPFLINVDRFGALTMKSKEEISHIKDWEVVEVVVTIKPTEMAYTVRWSVADEDDGYCD